MRSSTVWTFRWRSTPRNCTTGKSLFKGTCCSVNEETSITLKKICCHWREAHLSSHKTGSSQRGIRCSSPFYSSLFVSSTCCEFQHVCRDYGLKFIATRTGRPSSSFRKVSFHRCCIDFTVNSLFSVPNEKENATKIETKPLVGSPKYMVIILSTMMLIGSSVEAVYCNVVATISSRSSLSRRNHGPNESHHQCTTQLRSRRNKRQKVQTLRRRPPPRRHLPRKPPPPKRQQPPKPRPPASQPRRSK